MLLPADAMPRETRRRTTRWRDRRKERERETERSVRKRGVVGGGRGQVGSERNERSGMEVERGKSSVRSTIFPSRRAVTFYLASFGECSDWSVGKEISFFLRGEGNAGERARARARTHHTFRAVTSRSRPQRDVSSIKYFARQQSFSRKSLSFS